MTWAPNTWQRSGRSDSTPSATTSHAAKTVRR
jgi:hypothetical protein